MSLQSIKNRYRLVGRSARFELALRNALRVAPTDLSVLIYGESGVGKEAFSRIIHDNSTRKHQHFLAINCGALPEGTINAELFGHERGAFTGASEVRKGYFETTNGGTIFLDEIAEMPLSTQAFLLRILETGEFLRVGSSKVLHTNTRVIAATNKYLPDCVAQKTFREDLYYRLNTVILSIPSLSERRGDILPLFHSFASNFADKYNRQPVTLSESAAQHLVNLPLRGNIRELKNITERISAMTTNTVVDKAELTELLYPHEQNDSHLFPARRHEPTAAEHDHLYKWMGSLQQEVNELRALFGELTQKLTPATLLTLPPATPRLLSSPAPPADTVEYVDKTNQEEPASDNLSLLTQEKLTIMKALQKYHGRRKQAAKELQISARTLYRKIKDYGLTNQDFF